MEWHEEEKKEIMKVKNKEGRDRRDKSPWWWRQYAPLKRRSVSARLHGATSTEGCNLQADDVHVFHVDGM
jgi:hypothetical protein